jgi:dUTP pyrophosphatase
MNLVIKTLPGAITPIRANPTDAGLDLCAFEDKWVMPSEVTLVETGISIRIPKGQVGLLFQRSSFVKYGLSLANSVGVIDSDYRGTIKVAFRSHAEEVGYLINKGDRIAQLVIVPISLPDLVYFVGTEEEWVDTSRGEGGFGSTGK